MLHIIIYHIFRAQVTLTDLPEALTLLRHNINENKTKIASMGGYALAESFVWGDITSEILMEEFDLILLADCVYYEEVCKPTIIDILLISHFKPQNKDNLQLYLLLILVKILFQAVDQLMETLLHLKKNPTIYLTQEIRNSDVQKKIWESFYQKLNDSFYIEQIPEEQHHASYRSSDIILLRITKK